MLCWLSYPLSCFQDLFSKYGRLKRCDVKGTFAFVTFEDERDAEDALEECQSKELYGTRLVSQSIEIDF
jgi:RNA recognition motif-containing protein